MGKIAFIYPGQGSQYVGMGEDLLSYREVAALFQEADKRLSYSLSEIILKGPEEELKLTQNTQPAILTVSTALHMLLENAGITPDFVAGHSLGEYSALVASKTLSFTDAVYAVRMRGLFMDEAVPAGVGTMAAVMGLEADSLEAVCQKVTETFEPVQMANINSPSQIVISGTTAAVERASEAAKEAGAKRVIPLQVSGPFHSVLMQPAAEKLSHVLKEEVTLSHAKIPVVANVTANQVTEKDTIFDLLIKQLTSPVRWVESVEYMLAQGVDTFVEVGPGSVLSGLVKKVNRRVTVLPVNNQETLQKAIQELKGDA